jgi:hypothetical protein
MTFLDQILIPHIEQLNRVAVLEFTDLPPGLNKTKGRHWSQNNADRRAWRELAWGTAKASTPYHIPGRAFLHFHVRLGDKIARDEDNLRGAMKPVQDGLVDAGLIRGDSVYDIETYYSFSSDGPRGFTITVYVLPEA